MPEFRQQMVELLKSDRKPKGLAAKFGCHVTSIVEWVRQAQIDEQGKAGEGLLTTAERQELIRLCRQSFINLTKIVNTPVWPLQVL